MAQYQITGGVPLQGTLQIGGRKNAALKLIAATLLSHQPTTLTRVPEIGDVQTMLLIMRELGVRVEHQGEGRYQLDTSPIQEPAIPTELGRKLRSSVVLVGPLLARFGRASFPHPGGCVIGKRSISPHLRAFEDLGANVRYESGTYHIETPNGLRGATIYLKERSVTGTENLIMAAVAAQGTTNVYNAAEEPHISNLCDLLRAMGYQIEGDGTSHITIHGTGGISDASTEMAIIADDIEVGTFAVAAAITGGTVDLLQVGTRMQLFPILSLLEDFQVKHQYDEEAQTLKILAGSTLKATDFTTNTWPGFPSDLQSPFTVLATQAEGTSLIHDWMYEGRLYFVSALQSMGANITICDPHRALVTGPTRLTHNSFISPDLRAGAALVLAALIAKGPSVIEHAELIDRGYGQLDKRLQALGATITRQD